MRSDIYLGKTKKGGIVFPKAETAMTRVTRTPLSADVTAPICFCPRRPTIFSQGTTVVHPVSSIFQIQSGEIFSRLVMRLKLLKNKSTLCLLKDEIRPREVASGFLIDKVGCLLRKPLNQSAPALFFFFPLGRDF